MTNLIDIIEREMKLRNYSAKTINAYVGVIRDFYSFFKKPLKDATVEDVKKYLFNKQQKGLSSQTIVLCASAFNFLYCQIYKRNDWKIKELQKKYKGFFSDYLKKRIAREGNFI